VGQHPFQTNFTAGELSPFLYARTDYKKYPNGIELGQNAVVKVTGGISRAAGSEYIAKGKDRSAFQASMVQDDAFQLFPTKGARLVPFVFNTQEAYVLEMGHKYIRFFRNRAQLGGGTSGAELVLNGGFAFDLTSWTLQQDNGGVVTWQAPGMAQLDPGTVGVAGVSQSIGGLVIGDTYVVTFDLGGGDAILNIGTTFQGGQLVTERTLTVGSYRVTFVAATAVAVISLRSAHPSVVARVDNVSMHSSQPLEIATPYKATDVRSLRFTQSADVMYITHGSYPTKKLVRLSDSVWTLQDVVLTPPPTVETPISPVANLTPGAVLGTSITFTADVANTFVAADINRQIKAQGGVAIIKTFTDGQHVVADIVSPFISTDAIPAGIWSMDGSPSSDITLSATKPINAVVTVTLTTAGLRSSDAGSFIKGLDGILEITTVTSPTVCSAQILKAPTGPSIVAGAWTLTVEAFSASQGYAEVCNFFEQRLWLAKKFTLWGSVSGDFENFADGVKDDDAVSFPIVNGSNQVDIIRWIKSMQDNLVGSIGSEYRVFGGLDQAITPTHILIKPQSAWGSDPEPDAVRAGAAVLFVQRGRVQIREMAFDFSVGTSYGVGGYKAADIAVMAEHIFRSGIVELAYCSSPESYILAVTEDGRIGVCTYYREEEVTAWTQLQPAKWVKGSNKNKYLSVCVIPAKCGSGDEIWALVQRTINGRSGLYIEVFDGQLNTQCALVYDDVIPADTIVGLSHLESETVDVVYRKQSAFQKSFIQATAFQRTRSFDFATTVVGGAVVVPKQAIRIEVGLHYDTTITTLDLDMQTQQGTAQFRRKRSPSLYTRFYCSHGDGITVNGESVDRFELEAGEIYDFIREANLGWNRKDKVTIRQTKPYSMTVLGVSRNFMIDDGDAP
jgi:hypothetical protein